MHSIYIITMVPDHNRQQQASHRESVTLVNSLRTDGIFVCQQGTQTDLRRIENSDQNIKKTTLDKDV
jgi:hypothetical protein